MKIKKPNDLTGNLLKTKRINPGVSGSELQRRRYRGIQKNVLIGAAKVCPPCSICVTGRGIIDSGVIDDDTSSSISGAASVGGAKPTLRKVLRHSSCVLDTLLRNRPVRRRRRRAGSDGDCGNHHHSNPDDNHYHHPQHDHHYDEHYHYHHHHHHHSHHQDADIYRDKSEECRQYYSGTNAAQGERMRCYSDSETVVKKEKEPSYRSQNNLTGPADPPPTTATDQNLSQVATDDVLLGGPHSSQEESEVLISSHHHHHHHASLNAGGARSQHCPFFKRLSLREEPQYIGPCGEVEIGSNAGLLERSPSLQQLGVFGGWQGAPQCGGLEPGDGAFYEAQPPPCVASSTCSSNEGPHYHPQPPSGGGPIHPGEGPPPFLLPSSHNDLTHTQSQHNNNNNMFTGDDYAASYMDLMIHIPNLRL